MEICAKWKNTVFKIEKVIKKDLHVDTDEEKAQKMKTLIDKAQDEEILANKKAIDIINGNGKKKK